MSLMEKPAETPARKAFYDQIDRQGLARLRAELSDIITAEPKSGCAAHLWKFEQIISLLLEAGGLIAAKEIERRLLILENPGLKAQSRITTSLYAGLQLIKHGEVAAAHRHSQSALVLDGHVAHTAVARERTVMHYGDFIITPPYARHDHGTHSSEPIIWLDALDIPIVSLFDRSFAEGHPREEQPIVRKTGDSLARCGTNMLPVDFKILKKSSPLFSYAYERSREALEQMRQQAEWDPCHGMMLRYVNPVDGGFAMPTIASFLQLIRKGFSTDAYRSTDRYRVRHRGGKQPVKH